MSPLDFIWPALAIIALQPWLTRRFNEAKRRTAIKAIERTRGTRVITLMHRQESVNFLGVSVLRYIDLDDAEAIARAIAMTAPTVPIDLILHTPGGLMIASMQIARALKQHDGKVTVFVPHYAMSGGTLIALAANEIVMSRSAVLGAVDPQIDGLPASSLMTVVSKKPLAEIDDETLILADMAGKAVAEIAREVRALLPTTMPAEKTKAIADALTEGRWTHDYGLSARDAEELGLAISQEVPVEIGDLMDLYQQPVRRLPAVEFSPSWRESVSRNGRQRPSHR